MASIDALLLRAYRGGVDCSLEELRAFDEFAGMSLLQSIEAIGNKVTGEGLALHPPIDEGEIDQVRVLARAETAESFQAAAQLALDEGEGLQVEFKESLYLRKKVYGDKRVPIENWVSEDIVFEVIATICSFLNGDGGTLLIGVSDANEVVGIDCEFDFIPGKKKDLDGWDLFLSNCLAKFIYEYKSCLGYVKRKIVFLNNKPVCVVVVKKRLSSLTVCQAPGERDSEKVYVRNGNGKAEIRARAIEQLVIARLSS